MSVLKNLSVTSCVFMAIFVLSSVSAQNELELSDQSDLESMEEIGELLREVQTILEVKMASKIQQWSVEKEMNGRENRVVCNCSELTCSCCHEIAILSFRLKTKGCLNVTYIPSDSQIQIFLTFRSREIINKKIDAKTPPIECGPIPFLKRGGKVCLDFKDTVVTPTSFKGCATIRVRVFSFTVLTLSFGCLEIGTPSAAEEDWAKELPYIDGEQVPWEGPEPLYLGEIMMERIKPSEYKKK